MMTKFCARWVTRMLYQKWRIINVRHQMKIWRSCSLNWNLVLQCNVIGSYDLEFIQQSMQWKHASSPSYRKVKVQASASKIMCTIFWDAKDILLIGFMPHKVTVQGFITLAYFTICLSQLKRIAEESWPRYSFFCMTINLLIGSHTGQATLLESGFAEMRHPCRWSSVLC